MTQCPCGSQKSLETCCGPIIDSGIAPSAEAMMRSRYSAYVLCRSKHLEVSLAPDSRKDFDLKATESWAKAVEWQGLTIVGASGGEESGTVEFIARFRQDGQEQSHHELSRFRKIEGNWLYVDGDVMRKPVVRAMPKVGRNDPCPCGSGRKYKQCCGKVTRDPRDSKVLSAKPT